MHKIALFLFLAVGCCANTFASAAIMSPFISDFSASNPASIAPFTPSLSGQWSLVGEMYRNTIIAAPPAPEIKTSSSILQYTSLGGLPASAQDFSLSTKFLITNSVGYSNSIGFAVLGNTADATSSTASQYLANVFIGGPISETQSMNGKLRITEVGPATNSNSLDKVIDLGKILSTNIEYLLTLQGKYNQNGDLSLKLELSGDNDYDLLQLDNPIAATNVLTGNYFGFRNRATGGADSALTVEFDSVNIAAIPEPSSFGFVATSLIAGYAIGTFMRRRMAKQHSA